MDENRSVCQLTALSNLNNTFDMGSELLPQINVDGLLVPNSEGFDANKFINNHLGGGEQVIDMIGDEKFNVSDSSTRPIAIRVRDAVKTYQAGEVILNHLNLTVNEGTIYTLLGSSGCGKTTLLSCIIGFQQLDAGEILVFGSEPCSEGSGVPGKLVGYMPQETSLYPSLSIRELLEYFGTLYGMNYKEVQERINFLIDFLHLPDASKYIGNLSGGQKRRVSFAVSLLPDPPLLILDEPTVGVDPLLRESIWDHLVDLVSRKKTTVIITTHYIEESRKSDTIGLMRNGKLLLEKSPQSLLEEHCTTLLSPIVLKLCKEDSSSDLQTLGTNNTTAMNNITTHTNKFSMINGNNNNKCLIPGKEVLSVQRHVRKIPPAIHTRNHLWAMMRKNTMLITRNYLFLLFLICVPAIQTILFCLAVGNDPKPLPFGVVNHEVNFSEPCFTMPDEEGCMVENLSCQLIEKIPKDQITLHHFETEKEAMENLLMGRIWGYFQFPEDYSTHFYTRASAGSQFVDNETFEGSDIRIEMDASSKQITATLIKVFTDSFTNFSRSLLTGCGFDERIADMPLKYLPPVFGDYTAGFREFLAPSLVLGILFFFPIISSSMQCIREKKQGTLERTIVAGVRTWEILTAYSITESAIVLLQTALGFFIMSAVFQIPIKGSATLVVVLCMLIGLSGVSVGFLIGNFCREETEAALLSMAVFFPNFILAGMFWPIEGLPVYLQYVAYSLPCTLASESIRSIVTRAWGFYHPKVWPGFAVTIGWITTYWILNIIFHTRASIRRKR